MVVELVVPGAGAGDAAAAAAAAAASADDEDDAAERPLEWVSMALLFSAQIADQQRSCQQ